MSRVVMLRLDEDQVVSKCAAADVGVSAIESLPDGGVRLVCMSSNGAETMRRKLKSSLIKTDPRRELRRPRTPLW